MESNNHSVIMEVKRMLRKQLMFLLRYLRQPILQLTINHVNNTDEILNNKMVQKRRLLYKREREVKN